MSSIRIIMDGNSGKEGVGVDEVVDVGMFVGFGELETETEPPAKSTV